MAASRTSEPADGREQTPLKERISHVLAELRVVLPGTQALLGFQLVAVFSNGFDALDEWVRYLHFASLSLVMLSAVMLLTPASFHRIAEGGDDSERVHRMATGSMVAAMVLLGAGTSLDLMVIGVVVTGSAMAAGGVALVSALVCGFAWFGYPMLVRANDG